MTRSLDIHPLTQERWPDLLELFGENGAYSNCWCTYWILGKDFDRKTPQERRCLLENLTRDGEEPGLLAYRGGVPVGWVAVGPRERYPRMSSARARVYGPVDDTQPSWVINCFYIPRPNRRQGIAGALLAAAAEFALAHGAAVVEGYPSDTDERNRSAAELYTGTLRMFLDAGFREMTRRSTGRPVVRLGRPTE